jgi:hypothetical protein
LSGREYCWPIEKTRRFFAVRRALGLHHQTVQRRVEHAVVEGPMAAFDDSSMVVRYGPWRP